MEIKKCSKCGQEKPVSAFYKSAKAKDGLQSYCRECQSNNKSTPRKVKKAGGGVVRVDKRPASIEGNPLSGFTPRELMRELYRRGYDGELTFIQRTNLANM